MKSRQLRRTYAIFMLSVILSWTILPGIAMADWLKAGKSIDVTEPITGGEAITGGQSFTGGEFITPGEVYTYGSAFKGTFSLTSGTVIVPVTAENKGLFLIPSTLNGTKYGEFLKAGDIISGGESPTGGQVSGPGGTPPASGEAVSGGEGPNGGQAGKSGDAPTGGEGPSGGNASTGGKGPDGGNPGTGGEAPSGGEGPNGGEGPTGGDGPTGGNGPTGGEGPDGGTGPSGGDSPTGGDDSTGGESPTSGEGPSGGDSNGTGDGTSGNTTGGGPTIESALNIIGGVDKYSSKLKKGLTIFDGFLSISAGFKITDLKKASGNKNLFQVDGKTKVMKGDNFVSKWVNKRYNDYLGSFENRKDVVKGDSKSEYKRKWYDYKKRTHNDVTFSPRTDEPIREKKLQGFLKEVKSKKMLSNAFKDYFKDFVPNKEFFHPKTLIKGNGLTSVLFTVSDNVKKNYDDPKRTGTDFAAGVTTDVIVGAATAVAGAGAAWGATAMTAAIAGSVIPGVGTIAAVLGALAFTALTKTPFGERITGAIEAGAKKVFEGVKNYGKSIFKKFGWGS
ncbi:hypothetical protein [Sporosarcina koreensis]|uniref:Uncharacterized protein n=1 Tax=Sporosarcina koreensis TaxID=334735 RepID=A0ABW0U267_9BACL